jgi:hypothetical protein
VQSSEFHPNNRLLIIILLNAKRMDVRVLECSIILPEPDDIDGETTVRDCLKLLKLDKDTSAPLSSGFELGRFRDWFTDERSKIQKLHCSIKSI